MSAGAHNNSESSSMKYQQHPLSAAFPAMQKEEYQSLVDSINSIGVQNPITLLDGMVIDGWHRYQAANELSMDCPVVHLNSDVDPRDFVLAQNKNRRHITSAQLAMATTAVYAWAPAGKPKLHTECAVKTTSEMAGIAGVHRNTIVQAQSVQAKASPEVQAAVKDGSIGLPKAVAISKMPIEQQAAAISKPLPKQEPKVSEAIDLHELAISDDELIAENTRVQTENNLLHDTIKSLQVSDKDAEIKKLQERVYGLEGLLQQARSNEKRNADNLKYHTDLIHKLRKIYGVETHKEILAAAQAQVA